MPDVKARLIEGPQDFATNTVRLMVRRDGAFLMADGTWVAVAEGSFPPDDAGVVLPRDAIEAIAVAIAEWQGHVSHADTEARVLREWLAAERDRGTGLLHLLSDQAA